MYYTIYYRTHLFLWCLILAAVFINVSKTYAASPESHWSLSQEHAYYGADEGCYEYKDYVGESLVNAACVESFEQAWEIVESKIKRADSWITLQNIRPLGEWFLIRIIYHDRDTSSWRLLDIKRYNQAPFIAAEGNLPATEVDRLISEIQREDQFDQTFGFSPHPVTSYITARIAGQIVHQAIISGYSPDHKDATDTYRKLAMLIAKLEALKPVADRP